MKRQRQPRQSIAAADPGLPHQSPLCNTYWNNDGMLVVDLRLPPEQSVLFSKALDQAVRAIALKSALSPNSAGPADRPDAARPTARSTQTADPRAALLCDALVRICEGYLEHRDRSRGAVALPRGDGH